MRNRLDPACDRDKQTDGQTDGRTDRKTDILPWHSPHYAYASRGKKENLMILLCYTSLKHIVYQ